MFETTALTQKKNHDGFGICTVLVFANYCLETLIEKITRTFPCR